MPKRPSEAEFATDRGRVASPARMNEFSDYLLQRMAALEATRPEWESAVAELKAVGLSRVTEVLQPIYDNAVAIGVELEQLRAALAAPDFRAELIAETVAAIVEQGLFVRCGEGAEGLTLYSGAGLPDGQAGQAGDLYAYVEPD